MSSESPASQPVAPIESNLLPFADFGQRVAAFLIDIVIVTILALVGLFGCGFLSGFLFVSLADTTNPSAGNGSALLPLCLQCLIWLGPYLVIVAYHSLQLPRSGQTIGKRIMKIQVVSKSGDPPTFSQAVGRTLAYSLSELILFIGYFFPLWDEQRQALHDKVAGTYVVKRLE